MWIVIEPGSSPPPPKQEKVIEEVESVADKQSKAIRKLKAKTAASAAREGFEQGKRIMGEARKDVESKGSDSKIDPLLKETFQQHSKIESMKIRRRQLEILNNKRINPGQATSKQREDALKQAVEETKSGRKTRGKEIDKRTDEDEKDVRDFRRRMKRMQRGVPVRGPSGK
jgi:hypothetical protein